MPLIVLAATLWLVATSAGGAEDEWTAPAAQAAKTSSIPADAESIKAGQRIYLKRCAGCHGKTGDGDGPDAVELGLRPARFSEQTLRQESDGALFWKITTGKKPMPSYGSRLSSTERWNVINFLRTLTRK